MAGVTVTAPEGVMINPDLKQAKDPAFIPQPADYAVWAMIDTANSWGFAIKRIDKHAKYFPNHLTMPSGHRDYITGMTDLDQIDMAAMQLIASKGGETFDRPAWVVIPSANMGDDVPAYIPHSTYTDEFEVEQNHTWTTYAAAYGRSIQDESDGGNPAAPSGNKIIECSDGQLHFAGSVLVQLDAELLLSVTLDPNIYRPES